MHKDLTIQKFTDYRTFLVAHAQEMKQKKRSWSYSLWSKNLGLKATSSLTKIIQGHREPGELITKKLIQYFKFDDKQAAYFKDLVRLKKIQRDPKLCVLLMEKMDQECADSPLRILDDKTFLIISNWYFLALRELFRIRKMKEDPLFIAEKFHFKVNSLDISKAINILIEKNLLARNKNGSLCVADGRLDTTNDISSEAIKRYHEQMLENAKTALRSLSVEEREFTSTTFVMNSNKIKVAKELIRDFKARFEALLDDDKGDQVYQIQIQLFPLTQQFKRNLL